MNIALRAGDTVRRRNPITDMPEGATVTVTRIYFGDDFSICELSDGKSAFDFDLRREAFSRSFAASTAISA